MTRLSAFCSRVIDCVCSSTSRHVERRVPPANHERNLVCRLPKALAGNRGDICRQRCVDFTRRRHVERRVCVGATNGSGWEPGALSLRDNAYSVAR